jgi:hypothetical protein
MRPALLTLFAILVLAACGGGNGEEAEEPAAPATTTEAAPATTEEESVDDVAGLAETPLTTILEEGYTVEEGTPRDPEPADLPVEPGTVEAHWYKSGDNWVVVYIGVPADAGPLCPGNSILVGTSFEDTTNSATEGADCGSADLAKAPAGAQVCGENIVYVTAIPSAKEGALVSSIEVWEEEFLIHGVTGVTSTNRGEAPEVELSELGC